MATSVEIEQRTREIESVREVIVHFGPAVAAHMLGLCPHKLRNSAAARGIKYAGGRIDRMPADAMATRVEQARAWLAAGADPKKVPKQQIQHKDTGKFNRTLKIAQPAGVAPNVSIFDTGFQAGASVDLSRAMVTIAPPFVDRRFTPEPGYRGPFSLVRIGRDVQTGEAWA